jgi:hypothetical protein
MSIEEQEEEEDQEKEPESVWRWKLFEDKEFVLMKEKIIF